MQLNACDNSSSKSPSVLTFVLWVSLVASVAGCDIDPGVDDVRYSCTASGQCGEGYECRLDPEVGEEVCVPAGTTFDATADASADALDTLDDADATDAVDSGCDGGECAGEPVVITLNMDGPLRDSTVPPTIKSDGEGGLLVAGVFDRCLTLQVGVECDEVTERTIEAEGIVTAYDGFVLHLDERGETRALHKITAGINGLVIGYNPSLMTTDIVSLSTGDWLVGGTNWDDELTYNDSETIGAPDVPPGVSDEHHRWLVRSGDDSVAWGHRAGYAGHEYLASLDVNAADEVASSGSFAERYYRHPQAADGEFVASYSSTEDSENLVSGGLVEVWNPDGTVRSAIRMQSGYGVVPGVVALSDSRQVAVFGEFRDSLDVYYDSFDGSWTTFSNGETLDDYAAGDSNTVRQFLLVHADAEQQPVILDLGTRGSIDVWDARFDTSGELVAVGQFGSDVDFGDGNVSVGGFDSSSFVARWNPDNLSLENLVIVDSNAGDDGFLSVDEGPNGGDLVAGEFAGEIDYGSQTIESVAGTDSIVAEFADDGELLWHEVLPGAGTVHAFGAATLDDGRVAVLVQAENELEFRDTVIGRDGQTTTHIVIFKPAAR